jgi:three-Cys-motif partner protein
VAHELDSHFGEFVCINIEYDADNFQNLETVLNKYKYPKIKVLNIPGAFADVIGQVITNVGARLAPSFFFIDPFGFSGIPFNIVKDILHIPRTEVFITFMYRDINRFLESPSTQVVLNELFGTETGLEIQKTSGSREHVLRDLYIRQLREVAGSKFVWTFRISMTEERKTLYYLIYATNHFKGLMLMKTIMYNQGVAGDFSYLGPEDGVRRLQPSFFDGDVKPLRDLLLSRFKGLTLTYDQVEEQTWEEPYVDKHYRAVLKTMEKDGAIRINRISSKRIGLKQNDEISFL